MNTVISYINLVGCVMWLIWLWWNFPPAIILDAWRMQRYDIIISSILPWVVVITGIYLFIIGRRRAWSLQTENEILEKRIEQFKLKNKLNELMEGPDEI